MFLVTIIIKKNEEIFPTSKWFLWSATDITTQNQLQLRNATA